MNTLRRFFQIAWAIGTHMLWWGLVRLRVIKPSISPARHLARMLEGLGTTFVKLGQGLSMRQDFLPDEYVQALQSLQDRVQPFPAPIARREIEAALGDTIENLFASFEDEPLAAASIAQVHKATLPGGQRVIVKVRRPGLKDQVSQDIRLLRIVLRILLFLAPQLQRYALPDIVRENALTLMKEMDFRQEMR
ncbi:MAG TPA: AarF/ABC1/UbiB kinase family protein, partial [Chromatiales bacterium]|nr:AarF/ABC1/UbiB kinase family protein [Chromatiales bacterium]